MRRYKKLYRIDKRRYPHFLTMQPIRYNRTDTAFYALYRIIGRVLGEKYQDNSAQQNSVDKYGYSFRCVVYSAKFYSFFNALNNGKTGYSPFLPLFFYAEVNLNQKCIDFNRIFCYNML